MTLRILHFSTRCGGVYLKYNGISYAVFHKLYLDVSAFDEYISLPLFDSKRMPDKYFRRFLAYTIVEYNRNRGSFVHNLFMLIICIKKIMMIYYTPDPI